MTSRIIYIGALLLFITSTVFAGGPWTQNRKSGYAQLSISTISSNLLYNNNGGSYQLYRKVTDNTIQGFFEYGLTHKLTLIGNIPLKIVATGNETFNADTALVTIPFPAGDLEGVGNISAALKYKLVDASWKLAAQLRMDANTLTADAATGLQTGYDCWSYQPSLLAGVSRKHGTDLFLPE